jgi:hypothetical protein
MMVKDDGTGLNGMIGSARYIAREFLWPDSCGISPSIRCLIDGPRFSGKSSFLRTLFLEFLGVFTNSGSFKSVFIVPLNLDDVTFDTAETFYELVSNAVVTALLGQRMDLELFANSLYEGFSTLLKISEVRRLPKPLSYQDYLRRPMQMVDQLLSGLHALYHSSKHRPAFLEQVASLPIIISSIFGFASTFFVIDHLDRLRVVIDRTDLLDLVGGALGRCQYLVSGTDCRSLWGLRPDWNVVSVIDTCRSEYRDRFLTVQFRNKNVRNIRFDSKACAGCPVFVSRFDDICRALIQYEGLPGGVNRDELMVCTLTNTEILLDLLFTFGDLAAHDGGPPIVTGVNMYSKRNPKESRK